MANLVPLFQPDGGQHTFGLGPTVQRHAQVHLRHLGVLGGQRLRACAFAGLERRHQHVVLTVGVQHPVAVGRHGALHGQHGGRGRKRQLVIQRHRPLQGPVATGVQDQRMKAVVHGCVGRVAFESQRVGQQCGVARVQAGLQVALQLARDAMLGHQPRGHALQVAAHGNSVGHFLGGVLAHLVLAGLVGLDQAFAFQRGQRRTHRRTRGAQPLGQLLLGQALTGREFAPKNQVAQLDQNGLLQAHGDNCTLNFNFGIPF